MTKHPPAQGLPRPARNLLAVIAALVAAIAVPAAAFAEVDTRDAVIFLVLAAVSAMTQLFAFHTKRNQVFHATAVFFLAGAVLLPAALLLLLPLVSHVPDWVRRRYAWYIQTFNILNFTLALGAAAGAIELTARLGSGADALGGVLSALAGVAVYVAVNNAGFTVVLRLARGHDPRSILTRQILLTDLGLASMGVAVATIWLENPLFVPFAIAPLVLLQQSLHLPELQEEAREAKHLRALASVTEPEPEPGEAALGTGLLPSVLRDLGADGGVLLLRDGDQSELRLAAEAGLASPAPPGLSVGGALTTLVATSRVPYLLSRESDGELRAELAARGIGSFAAAPLVEGDRLVGVLHLVCRRPGAFSGDDVRFLQVLAGRLARQVLLARARLELAEAYALRHGALEASRTGVCVYSADGSARFWNSAFVGLVDADPASAGWPSGQGDSSVPPIPPAGGESRFRTGGDRCLRARATALAGGDLLVSVDDVTDEVREAETRARFVAEVVGAQDREARRIAELLHDDAVQQLTALVLRLELEATRGAAPLLALARDGGAIIASLRRLLVQLHPAVLESQGVAAAVDAAAETLRTQGVAVEVSPLNRRLPAETEQLAYRLAQEGLANVLKHARAGRVDVELTASATSVRCQVSDDGCGLDAELVASAVGRGRLGLQLVRDRVELAGGRFLLESRPGGGTVFAFELPFTRADAPAEPDIVGALG